MERIISVFENRTGGASCSKYCRNCGNHVTHLPLNNSALNQTSHRNTVVVPTNDVETLCALLVIAVYSAAAYEICGSLVFYASLTHVGWVALRDTTAQSVTRRSGSSGTTPSSRTTTSRPPISRPGAVK